MVKCGSSDALLCGNICDQLLDCQIHHCTLDCHTGACNPCSVVVEQKCFCTQQTRKLACSLNNTSETKFECGLVCSNLLECGKHQCDRKCHAGSCGSCSYQVAKVIFCPCGKMKLADLYKKKKSIIERKDCMDPVPVCGQICGRILTCGPMENHHSCLVLCHEGPCPPCCSTSIRRCRCGRNEKEIPCPELESTSEVLCEKRCNKKRQCGRHKCIQNCCVDKVISYYYFIFQH